MSLYVYAVLRESPRNELGIGLGGESLRLIACGDLLAVTGDVPTPPVIDTRALRAHDAVVRRIAALVESLLPVRFGTVVQDERALEEALCPRAARLMDALALVAGREQMTVRMYGERPALPADDAAEAGGPGARYLAGRLRAQRARAVPHLERLQRALAPLVHAERVERHDAPPLLASIYHLIPRDAADRYLDAVDALTAELAPLRLGVSGPWPPYAFAPGVGPDTATGAVA